MRKEGCNCYQGALEPFTAHNTWCWTIVGVRELMLELLGERVITLYRLYKVEHEVLNMEIRDRGYK